MTERGETVKQDPSAILGMICEPTAFVFNLNPFVKIVESKLNNVQS